MAKVKAFSVEGIELWIYSGDHEPPHFHARRRGDWTVRVFILEHQDRMIQLIGPADAKISAKHRKALIDGVLANRERLLKEWQACQPGV